MLMNNSMCLKKSLAWWFNEEEIFVGQEDQQRREKSFGCCGLNKMKFV
jgi:hypothetical protein